MPFPQNRDKLCRSLAVVFKHVFSDPASCRAAQCCEAFKAEVSFWCYPRLAIPLSRWRALFFYPSPITVARFGFLK